MVHNLKIDFDNNYDIEHISEDLRNSDFATILKDGSQVPLYLQISNQSHELLPDVYNPGFGPLKGNRIDDLAELPHQDYSVKVGQGYTLSNRGGISNT